MPAQDGISSSVVETVAGFTAGIVSTLCLHPLDLVKTRLQGDLQPIIPFWRDIPCMITPSSTTADILRMHIAVDRSSASRVGGSLRVIHGILQHEAGVTAFYRGLTPNLIGNSSSWALYFLCYDNIKGVMRTERGLTSADYFLASGAAGMLTSVLTNPIWVIKTRMLSTGSATPGAYASFTTGIRRIYQSEGIRGFYRGLLPALFGVSHGALQFMAYEQLKLRRTEMPLANCSQNGDGFPGSFQPPRRELGNLDFFVISTLSKLFAGCVTYPYQVLRSRLQTYDAHLIYRGIWDAITQIWAKEGIAGFYKGLGPNIFRVLPSTWVTFLVYENTRACLPRLISHTR